jgi:hypothetical protein
MALFDEAHAHEKTQDVVPTYLPNVRKLYARNGSKKCRHLYGGEMVFWPNYQF